MLDIFILANFTLPGNLPHAHAASKGNQKQEWKVSKTSAFLNKGSAPSRETHNANTVNTSRGSRFNALQQLDDDFGSEMAFLC